MRQPVGHERILDQRRVEIDHCLAARQLLLDRPGGIGLGSQGIDAAGDGTERANPLIGDMLFLVAMGWLILVVYRSKLLGIIHQARQKIFTRHQPAPCPGLPQ